MSSTSTETDPARVLISILTLLFLASGLPAPAQAQETDPLLRAQEMRAEAEGCSFVESFTATFKNGATSEDSTRFRNAVEALFDQAGTGAPYQLASLAAENPSLSFQASEQASYTRQITSPGEVEEATPFLENGATHVSTTTWVSEGRELKRNRFFEIREDGYYIHGYSFVSRGRTQRQIIDPPLRSLALPAEQGAQWSSETESTHYRNEFVGAGTVVTPTGDTPALVVRVKETDYAADDTVVTERIRFRRRHGNGVLGTIEMQGEDNSAEAGFVEWTDLEIGSKDDGEAIFCEYVGRPPVGFALGFVQPKEWSVVEPPAGIGSVLVRDSAAAEKISDESLSLSTREDEKMRLLGDDNVVIGISAAGQVEARAFLEQTINQIPLKNTGRVDGPSDTSIANQPASEIRVEGADADGRSVQYRQIAVPMDSMLVTITVLQPASPSNQIQESVQMVLESLGVASQRAN